jgi:SAM-dependent methyltransferase
MTVSFEFPGEYYEIIRADFRNTDAETSFLSSYLLDGAKVLDIGCGTGTNVRALAELGHRCVGVDQSRQFIDYACAQSPAGIEFVHARAAEYDTADRFDLIFSVFVTLNYLRRDELRVVLRNVRRWLRPGGTFVVDIGHMLNFADRYQPYIIAHHRRDDVLITRLTRHHVDAHTANWRHEETIIVRDGDKPLAMFENSFDQMVLTAPEITAYLEDCGLTVVDRFGSFRKEPPARTGNGHLILVAQAATERAHDV